MKFRVREWSYITGEVRGEVHAEGNSATEFAEMKCRR